MDFNSFQKKAIGHLTGPMQVIAGPGSGKTAVVTWRVRYLIEHFGIDPRTILTMTFSKAAAMEMSGRFQKIFPDCRYAPVFGTFHSVFYTLLQKNASGNLRILTEAEKSRILLPELKRGMGYDTEDEQFIHNLLNEISAAKNSGIPSSEYQPQHISKDQFLQYFPIYQKILEAEHAMDFDDILTETLHLLQTNRGLLSYYQMQYPFLQVDEFQDVNPIQYAILRLLGGKRANIFTVGDDDQSIYGFRGAQPSIMQQFSSDYPGCKKIVLGFNYRCPGTILNPSHHLITKNRNRISKTIYSQSENTEATFSIQNYRDQKEQYHNLALLLQHYHAENFSWSDMCILLRGKQNVNDIARQFMDLQIPYTGLQDISPLYSHFICQDILSYLRAASGKADRKDLLRIMEHPERQISRFSLPDTDLPNTAAYLAHMKSFDPQNPVLQKQICILERQLDFLKVLTPYAAITYILKACGYEQFLREQGEKNREEHLQNDPLILRELLARAKASSGFEDFLNSFSDKSEPTADAVHILTLHGAKGLEFPVVCIPDLNQGILPSGKGDLEEERRLLYVGMTRASCHLHLSYVSRLHGKQVLPSLFLSDITEEQNRRTPNT